MINMVFFFFQAEDGIRDIGVTGVQTCALPIYPSADLGGANDQANAGMYAIASGGWWGVGLGASRQKWGSLPEAHTDFIFARSEERRVGKECRSRWSPYH